VTLTATVTSTATVTATVTATYFDLNLRATGQELRGGEQCVAAVVALARQHQHPGRRGHPAYLLKIAQHPYGDATGSLLHHLPFTPFISRQIRFLERARFSASEDGVSGSLHWHKRAMQRARRQACLTSAATARAVASVCESVNITPVAPRAASSAKPWASNRTKGSPRSP